MTDPIRFKLGLAGGLVTDAEGDWITYRTHVAAIARLTHERDALFGKLAEARVGRDVGDFDYPPGSAPCMCFFSTAEDRGPDPLGECDYHKALRSRLAEARCVCDEQATDAGLWFVAEMVTEAYLQAALRRLHAAVEGTADSASNREDERV